MKCNDGNGGSQQSHICVEWVYEMKSGEILLSYSVWIPSDNGVSEASSGSGETGDTATIQFSSVDALSQTTKCTLEGISAPFLSLSLSLVLAHSQGFVIIFKNAAFSAWMHYSRASNHHTSKRAL